MADRLEPLSRRYDVVVANPPYMGASNMNKWLNGWTKQIYPNTCKDLCTCFIERGMSLAAKEGYEALITSDTCMYISSFEKMRKMILSQSTIVTFIDTRGTNAHPDVFDANAGWVLANRKMPEYQGSYFKLNQPIQGKREGLLEALADPECRWFHRCNSETYIGIPGNPIAYWANEGLLRAFSDGMPLRNYVDMPYGFKTGDNERFLRCWWECQNQAICFKANSVSDAIASGKTWFPYNKGGSFRKWYGNNEFLLNYKNGGYEVIGQAKSEGRSAADYDVDLMFKPVVTWSRISSGRLHMRYSDGGAICDMTGSGYYGTPSTLRYLQGFCNSSIALQIAEILSPTLDFQPGQIGSYPVLGIDERNELIDAAVFRSRLISKIDWDNFEISWDFKKHPLI